MYTIKNRRAAQTLTVAAADSHKYRVPSRSSGLAFAIAAVLASGLACASSAQPNLGSISGDSHSSAANLSSDKELKRLYSLSSDVAPVGIAIRNAGWTFEEGDIGHIPNSTETIVYLDINTPRFDEKTLKSFLANFKGVVVLDSRKFFLTNQTELNELSETEKAAMSFGPGKELNDTYYAVMSDVAGKLRDISVNSSALVISMNKGGLFPLEVNETGQINGIDPADVEQLVSLDGVASENTENELSEKNYSSDVWVDIAQKKDGYWAIARVFVNALKSGNNKWSIDTYVHSGDKLNGCVKYIGGVHRKCGIYPASRGDIIKTTAITGGYRVLGWATKYRVDVNVFNSTGILAYQPTAASWGTSQYKETDAYEVEYNEGYPFSGVDWLSPSTYVNLAGNIFFGQQTSYRKSMQAWRGIELLNTSTYYPSMTTTGPTKPVVYAGSGVELDPNLQKIWRGYEGLPFSTEAAFEEEFRKAHFGKKLSPCGSTNAKTWKPLMSWEGWQPSFAAVHGVPAGGYSFNSNTKQYSIGAYLKWDRVNYNLEYRPGVWWGHSLTCKDGSRRWFAHWRIKGSGDLPVDELVTPSRSTYSAGTIITVRHDQF